MSRTDPPHDAGLNTLRMWAGLESLERSKVRLDDDLSDIEKELRQRIDKSVDVSQAQAEAIDALIHRVERLGDMVKRLECDCKKYQQALFGMDEGKEGLVVQQRMLGRMVVYGRIAVTAAFAALVFAFQNGWIRGPA